MPARTLIQAPRMAVLTLMHVNDGGRGGAFCQPTIEILQPASE
jgi:hypothetical protein